MSITTRIAAIAAAIAGAGVIAGCGTHDATPAKRTPTLPIRSYDLPDGMTVTVFHVAGGTCVYSENDGTLSCWRTR